MGLLSTLIRQTADWYRDRQVLRCVRKGNPVPFIHDGRRYYTNPDASAPYHLRHSTLKIQRMVDLIDVNPKIVFDVGGHVGLFSAFLARKFPSAEIHCFEPSKDLVPLVRMNCPASVQAHAFAVAETDTRMTLYVNREAQQTNSLVSDAASMFTTPAALDQRVVECRSIDSFMSELGVDGLDVLKIDVQGFEASVLRGAHRALNTVEQLFIESTWMDIESIAHVVPFALRWGFASIAVLSPVYLGADLLLSRTPVRESDSRVIRSFRVTDNLMARSWGERQ